MKKIVNLLGCKQLTNREALMLCACQAIMAFVIVYLIVLLQIGLFSIIWFFGHILPDHVIIMMSLTFNIMVFFQFIDIMNDLLHAALCKCEDYEALPEPEDEDD